MNFDSAIARVASFGPQIKVSDEDKLALYALFKQARNGDADDKDTPSRLDFVKSAKFRAWRNLKGVSREEAERRYVVLVGRLDPAWIEEVQQQQTAKKPSTPKVLPPIEEKDEQKRSEFSGGYKPVRRKSLDRNFTFNLKPASPPLRLSNTLEKVLSMNNHHNEINGANNVSTKSAHRPRGKSLDFESNFLMSPWIPVEEVGETVKRMVLKKDDNRIHSHLVGVGNARDFGGLPAVTADGKQGRIRPNILIRCAQFNEATEEDANWFLKHYGLKTIIDFRSADSTLEGYLANHFQSVHITEADKVHLVHTARVEAERLRIVLPLITRPLIKAIIQQNAPGWRKILLLVLVLFERSLAFFRKILAAIPIIEKFSNLVLLRLEKQVALQIAALTRRCFADAGLRALYLHLLMDGHELLRPALEFVTEPKFHPTAFHCSFGKDRTGIVAALVLHAAGVPRRKILEDFEISHHFVDTDRGAREWATSIREVPELATMKEEWARSPAESLDYALKQVEKRYGSLDGYFAAVLGFDQSWFRKVREILVEERVE